MALSARQRRCHGLGATGLEDLDGHRVDPAAGHAFRDLRAAAAAAGFDLRIASAYRSFERQRVIWNGKLSGERPVLDEADREIDLAPLGDVERIERVLRFSAMPGASRHHWGTDMDVYDAAAVARDFRLSLNAAEVAENGPFAPLHRWLDERIADGTSRGFFRPYDRDRGGVAPERWHLSFAPMAEELAREFTLDGLRSAWREARVRSAPVAQQDVLESRLAPLVERFVTRVAGAPATMTG